MTDTEKKLICPYNKFVECTDHNCERCGWNDKNQALRELRILKAFRKRVKTNVLP